MGAGSLGRLYSLEPTLCLPLAAVKAQTRASLYWAAGVFVTGLFLCAAWGALMLALYVLLSAIGIL